MGRKTAGKSKAGRPRGSVNRRTKEAIEHLKELQGAGLSCDPIDFLARIVAGDKEGLGLTKSIGIQMRLKAAIELAPYVAPKRKAIEVTTQGGVSPVIIVPAKAEGGSWLEKAQTIREEQQRVLQEKVGGA